MQLLFADVASIALGIVVHGALPWRRLTGALLLPAIAGTATAIVWAGFVWLRVPDGSGWLWLSSLSAGVLSALAAGLLLRTRRRRADDAQLATVARA